MSALLNRAAAAAAAAAATSTTRSPVIRKKHAPKEPPHYVVSNNLNTGGKMTSWIIRGSIAALGAWVLANTLYSCISFTAHRSTLTPTPIEAMEKTAWYRVLECMKPISGVGIRGGMSSAGTASEPKEPPTNDYDKIVDIDYAKLVEQFAVDLIRPERPMVTMPKTDAELSKR